VEFNLKYSELDLRHSKSDAGHSNLIQPLSTHCMSDNLIEEMPERILSNCVKRMLDGKKEESSPQKT